MNANSIPSQRFFLAMLLSILFLSASAQSGKRNIAFSKFTVKENVDQDGHGFTGIEMAFDVVFNWQEEEFLRRDFKLQYRLEQDGKTILLSSAPNLTVANIFTQLETISGKKCMSARQQKVFIPYGEIPLESGPQKATIVFSLSNDEGSYTDCYRSNLSWQHKKIVRHSLNEQVFSFQNIVFDYAAKELATNAQGMNIKADVGLKYGPEECLETKYDLACIIRLDDIQVYDSRQNSGDRIKGLEIGKKEGMAGGTISFFVKYDDLKMEGANDAELIYVLLGAEGGPKEIYAQKMRMNVPIKYNFEEQQFTLNSVSATTMIKDGVQGIALQYSCTFKFTSLLRNPDKGKYYFYAALFDADGKQVIDPSRAPKYGGGTAHLLDAQLPSPENTVAKGSLFIPYYILKLAAGNHALKFGLMVSDINLQTKFPILGNGSLDIQKPAELKYWLALEQLEMIDANYDVEFIPPGTHLPELQYLFCVGKDAYYESDYSKNSLSAIPGSGMLTISRGDEINIRLYDIDSGFFNDNDLQGEWKISYEGKANPFLYEVHDQGQVVNMRVKVQKQ